MNEEEKQARVRAIQRLLDEDGDQFVTQSHHDTVVKEEMAFIEARREAQLHAAVVAGNRRGY